MKHKRDEFSFELRTMRPGVAALCYSAEGGTSGKNSSTDQRQVQLTTGTTGANSPNLTATEGSGIGNTQISAGRDYITTDFGTVNRAFSFAENIANDVGQIFVGQADANKATAQSNSDLLNNALDKFAASGSAGQASDSNKTMLYIIGGVLVLVGAIFYFRR